MVNDLEYYLKFNNHTYIYEIIIYFHVHVQFVQLSYV